MQWWLYSSRVGLIERSKREMLECSKKNALHSLHKNIDDCMSFFRSSLSFSSIWQNIVLRFFFLFVSSCSSSSTERISLQYTMPWQRRYESVYMCSVSRERWCCPSYSFIQSFIDSHVVLSVFFTTVTGLSVCMFKLDCIVFD